MAAAAAAARKYDVVVWGCTGFTGRLACEYLSREYPTLKWAIAGRSEPKVSAVKSNLKLKDCVDVIVADISDAASLQAMTAQATVLLSTAGPFDKIGTPIVDSCVKTGTHYCDTTGEPQWVRKVADAYAVEAANKKVKIVNCCGFDCIPSDLGCQMMVDAMIEMGATPKEVHFIAGDSVGGASGGTLASMANIFESCPTQELLEVCKPYYLHPNKADRPSTSLLSALLSWFKIQHDKKYKLWTMPYIMQTINIPIVNRSNALLDWQWGKDLKYSESMQSPFLGPVGCIVGAIGVQLFSAILGISFLRNLLFKFLPSPGQGPSNEVLNKGYFKVMLWSSGVHRTTGETVLLKGSVEALHGDPGYR
jgi:short subunit dehydrogenase-like uncharacterized protein